MLVLPSGRLNVEDGLDCGDFARSLRYGPLGWQDLAFEVLLARNGINLACPTVVITAPRQNGKTVVAVPHSLYCASVLDEGILFTAHLMKTSRKYFLECAQKVNTTPWLKSRVAEMHISKDDQYILFKGGGVITIGPRTNDAGRGQTIHKVYADEAMITPAEQQSALLPVISAIPAASRQTILLGTAPRPWHDPAWFATARRAAIEGRSDSTGLLEWSAEPGCDLGDRRQWAKSNPSLGYHLPYASVEDEYANMTAVDFAAERLNQWQEDIKIASVFPRDLWDGKCRDTESMLADDSEISFAWHVSSNADAACVVVAGYRSDGLPHVEVIEHLAGPPNWVPEFIASKCATRRPRSLVTDRLNPGVALMAAVETATNMAVTLTGSSDYMAACAGLFQSVVASELRHRGQPVLDTSVAGVARRSINRSGGWGFAPLSEGSDIGPVSAAALALWALESKFVRKQKRHYGGNMSF